MGGIFIGLKGRKTAIREIFACFDRRQFAGAQPPSLPANGSCHLNPKNKKLRQAGVFQLRGWPRV
jgi:hypothetical protein